MRPHWKKKRQGSRCLLEKERFTRSPPTQKSSLLYNKHKRGKLIVQPDFQRDYVWDRKRASRLIESALLSIPIPIVYISEEPDNKEYVIDGQQRLTSFFSFLDGKFPDGGTSSGLRVFEELNGKNCSELTDNLQDVIRYFKLRTVTFKRESDENLKFEIFERLNTGAVPLKRPRIAQLHLSRPLQRSRSRTLQGARLRIPCRVGKARQASAGR